MYIYVCIYVCMYVCMYIYIYTGGADKPLARPNSRYRKMESLVSLERGVSSCAELQVLSCYRG